MVVTALSPAPRPGPGLDVLFILAGSVGLGAIVVERRHHRTRSRMPSPPSQRAA